MLSHVDNMIQQEAPRGILLEFKYFPRVQQLKISETQKYCEFQLDCVVWWRLSPVAIFRLLDCVVRWGLSPVAIFRLLDCVVR